MDVLIELTHEQYEILDHTVHRAAGQRYCGYSKDMRVLIKHKLMYSLGTFPWCPEEYFKITPKGLKALSERLT